VNKVLGKGFALRSGCALATLAMISACSGGSSAGGPPTSAPPPPPVAVSPPPPAPPPPPPPAPTPTGAPTSFNSNTAEFRRSDGPGFHGAVTAYEAGATGQGVTLGVIDSGIDVDGPEFAGRISSFSDDFAGNRGLDDEGGHGTAVSNVAAAARDNAGVLGIAFEAELLVLRADVPGSCTDVDPDDPDGNGCRYSNIAIAAGLDRAVEAGARVVNLSLGGANPPPGLRAAVARATNAGVVVIVSAGNDGDNPDVDGDNPDIFARGLAESGNGLVIIAGSVDDEGGFSDFSNRAGDLGDIFLSARGERICCLYEDGEIQVEDGFVRVFNGTSFAAPQIAGAAALLAQAFPTLSGEQIVQLLLVSARDAGANGTDNIFGRGILDIAAAFQPQGQSTLAGTNVPIGAGTRTGTTGAASGDAGQTSQSFGAVILDGFDRAFALDLARSVQSAQIDAKLAPALITNQRNRVVGGGGTEIAVSIAARPEGQVLVERLKLSGIDANRSRILATSLTTRLTNKTQIAFGYRRGVNGLTAGLQGVEEPAFLVAENSRTSPGISDGVDSSLAVRQQIGDFGVTTSLETGSTFAGSRRRNQLLRGASQFDLVNDPTALAAARQDYGYRTASIAIDRHWESIGQGLDTAINISFLDEDTTILGTQLDPLFGANGANSIFLDARLGLDLGTGWRIGGEWRQGFTRARKSGFVTGQGQLISSSFAFDVRRRDFAINGDRLAFRVSQPLRVSNGSLAFALPTGFDVVSQSAELGISRLNLAPRGREIASELSYGTLVWGGYLSTNLFFRSQPGHFQQAPDDMGVAARYNLQF